MEERSAVFSADPYLTDDSPLDAVFTSGGLERYEGQLTTRSLYKDFSDREAQTASASMGFYHFFPDKGELRAGANFSYTDEATDRRTERDIRYLREPAS